MESDTTPLRGFYEFQDANLRFLVPNWLRRKKSGYFYVPESEKKKHAVHGLAVGCESEDAAARHRKRLSTVVPPQERGKVIREVLRQQESTLVPDGFEILSRSQNLATGELIILGYRLLFNIKNRHIYVGVLGGRDQAKFEAICREIVAGIRLNDGSVNPTATQRRAESGGLNRADKARLSKLLDALPRQIACLRKPILEIAKEDQDLLGSGEGDIGPLSRALRKAAKSRDIESVAGEHAKLLRKWIESQPDNGQPWAVPIWFAVGALMGGGLYGMDEE
jgi:hypothetical protein